MFGPSSVFLDSIFATWTAVSFQPWWACVVVDMFNHWCLRELCVTFLRKIASTFQFSRNGMRFQRLGSCGTKLWKGNDHSDQKEGSNGRPADRPTTKRWRAVLGTQHDKKMSWSQEVTDKFCSVSFTVSSLQQCRVLRDRIDGKVRSSASASRTGKPTEDEKSSTSPQNESEEIYGGKEAGSFFLQHKPFIKPIYLISASNLGEIAAGKFDPLPVTGYLRTIRPALQRISSAAVVTWACHFQTFRLQIGGSGPWNEQH